MFKKGLLLTLLLFLTHINASYLEGKKIFENKCSSCHGKYISIKNLKINFFEQDNKIYKLTVPTVNMLAYAIVDGPKRIGDPEDKEMQEIEIEEYLKDYLEEPDISNTICDPIIIKYYEKKEAIKITDEEALNLTHFFMEYKKNRLSKSKPKMTELDKFYDENKILDEAKKSNKKLIIYATSKSCYFCKKMERDVLSLKEIQNRMNKDFIFLKVDVDEIKLPFNLKKHFKGMTPTFFFVSNDKELENIYPGAWLKDDFITILQENIDEK